MSLNKKRLALASAALSAIVLTLGTSVILLTNPDIVKSSAALEEMQKPKEPIIKYGFNLNDFYAVEDVIKPNQTLSELMDEYGVGIQTVDEMVKKSSNIFNLNKMRSGKSYLLLCNAQTKKAEYFIFEPSIMGYVIYDLRDSVGISKIDREVEMRTMVAKGSVKQTLWDAFDEHNLDPILATKMEQALKWSVDFHRTKKGDAFKLVYTEKYVEGKAVGIEELKACVFTRQGNNHYAIRFESADGEIEGFFDEKARPMKKAFLKAPVEFARVSSKFNLNRFHPVLQYYRPHLGTDFAAPHGTPILAISDGVVEEAAQRGGNGIYVKLKHDGIYGSQYLHMSRHAKGMTKGTRVKQGQIIGYVGSTGLATGPHVCFRFWKNGKQVDFLKEKLPMAMPMTGKQLPEFNAYRDSMLAEIAKIDKEGTVMLQSSITLRQDSLKKEVDKYLQLP